MTTQAQPGAAPAAPTAAAPAAAAPAAAPAAQPAAPATSATAQTTSGQPQGTTEPIKLQQDFSDWLGNKGVKDVSAFENSPELYKLAQAYRDTEKMVGQLSNEKLVLPKDPTTDEGKAAMQAIYDRLGRPAGADKYELQVPQGGDSAFALQAGEWFHKAGLSKEQGQQVAQMWNGYVEQFVATQEAEAERASAAALVELEKEWGADTKVNSEIATRALNAIGQELGWDANKLEAVRNGRGIALDARETLKLLKAYGDKAKVTGDSFEGGERGASSGGAASLTPAEAESRRKALIGDRAFQQRLRSGDKDAKAEWDLVHKIAGQGKQANIG